VLLLPNGKQSLGRQSHAHMVGHVGGFAIRACVPISFSDTQPQPSQPHDLAGVTGRSDETVCGRPSTSVTASDLFTLMRIADRYLLREMAWPFFGGLLAFVVMITGHMLFQAVEVMVDYRVPLQQVLRYLGYQVPSAAVLALPVSTLLAVGLSTNRLAADSELLAMRTAGMSRIRLMVPGLYLGLLATVLSLGLYHHAVPWAEGRADELIKEIAFGRRALLVRPGQFVNAGQGVVFLVDDNDPASGALSNIRVFYSQPDGFPILFSARAGRLHDAILEIDRAVFYALTPKDDPTWGEVSDISISLAEVSRAFLPTSNRLQAMSLSELRAETRRIREQDMEGWRQYLVEFDWRLALAASCTIFALLAGPIVGSLGHTQSLVGLLATLLIVFVYYVLMLWMRMLADAAVLPPEGVWLVNVLVVLIALGLLWRQK